jgi:hypothetical protein
MVCDSDNNRIQVFEPIGKFVGKFGKKANNLGELNFPWSVAGLSNGRVVVSDCGINSIQIPE